MVEVFMVILVLAFLIGVILACWVGYRLGALRRDRFWEREIPSHRKEAVIKSRAVLGGHFSEQLAPYLPGFEYLPTECKFIGKPMDFLVFRGMDNKDIKEVVFIEVKSGKAKLTSQEKKLKETIQKGRVRWEEYRIPEGLLGNKLDEEVEVEF